MWHDLFHRSRSAASRAVRLLLGTITGIALLYQGSQATYGSTPSVPRYPAPIPDRPIYTLDVNLGDEPRFIDPALAWQRTTDVNVVESLFRGLTSVDGAGNVLPELAESWEATDDLTTWTFMLREAWWVHYAPSQGVTIYAPLPADDVVYTVRRICDPRTSSPSAYLDYLIAGCAALSNADLESLTESELQALIDAVAE